jgi:conjugative coupling factor TraD (TOL family)
MIENLLRKPHEFRSTITMGLTASAVLLNPPLFAMNRTSAAVCAALAIAYGTWRGFQAVTLIRYQRNMRSMPRYELSAEEIPWSRTGLFLGRGFDWDVKHTQRLHQVRESRHRHFAEPGWLYKLARRLERRAEHGPFDALAKHLSTDAWWNPVPPLPNTGGFPELHGVGSLDEEEIWLNESDRVGHILVEGTTRVGKSRLLELLVTQDIHRGDAVIVFDPKGDEAVLRRVYAEAVRAGRADDFIFFHLGYPDISARYNPIGDFSRITEIAGRIAGNMPGGGDAEAFKNFVWQFVNNIARATHALGQKLTYQSLYQCAENIEPLVTDYYNMWLDRDHRGWRDEIDKPEFSIDEKKLDKALKSRAVELVMLVEFVRRKRLYDPIASGLATVITYENSYFQKLVGSLYPFLGKVTTGAIADLLSPDYSDLNDKRRIFDWDTILSRGGIVYVGLDSLEDQPVASAVGSSMFSDLTANASRIYKHGVGVGQFATSGKLCLSIHGDEFAELIGDDFIPLANKAGGAGYRLTMYSQTRADIAARLKDESKALQVEGNFNTRIFLRVLNAHTAELMTDSLPQVQLDTVVPMSSASDTNDPFDSSEFGSSNSDRITRERVPMLEPSEFIELPKGQAFVMMHGGRLHKVRLPLPVALDDPVMPTNLDQIAHDMGQRYERSNHRMTDGAPHDLVQVDSLEEQIRRATLTGRGARY